jgi:hypothetical protein
MEYKPLKEEYLFDVAVKLYGDAVIGVENILSLNVSHNLQRSQKKKTRFCQGGKGKN